MASYFSFPTVEPDHDLLTCVDCHKEFPLSDIVKFIEHKVSRCNKENIQPFNSEDDHRRDNNNKEADDDDDSEAMSVISSRRTSISAPIARRGTPELREKSSPRPLTLSSMSCDGNEMSSSTTLDDQSETDGVQAKTQTRCVDVGSNTTHTGRLPVYLNRSSVGHACRRSSVPSQGRTC